MRQRLGRLAGLRRDDEERLAELDLAPHREDRRRVGGVQHVHLRVAFRSAKGVAQHVRPKAGAAHPEQDHVGVDPAVERQLTKFGRVLEHLFADAQPTQTVANLLALGGIRAPQGRVLGPQAAPGLLFLQRRQLRVDRGLKRPEAVPLPRTLARLDVLRGLRDRLQEALERFRERGDAFDLQLVCDLVEVDARGRELLQLALRKVQVLVEAAAHLAVLAEGRERRGRNGVDRVGADELLDVVGVRIAGILGRRAGPERTLRAGAGLAQPVPARTVEELLEVLVRHLGVGDRGLAVQALELALLGGVRDGLDLVGQHLVDLGVDPADEEARHARDLAEVPSLLLQLLEPGEVRLDDLVIAVDGEDQRDVDVVALGDLVLDRGQPFLGRRDLDHHVRAAGSARGGPRRS